MDHFCRQPMSLMGLKQEFSIHAHLLNKAITHVTKDHWGLSQTLVTAKEKLFICRESHVLEDDGSVLALCSCSYSSWSLTAWTHHKHQNLVLTQSLLQLAESAKKQGSQCVNGIVWLWLCCLRCMLQERRKSNIKERSEPMLLRTNII